MKNINLLQVALIAFILVVAVSCTTMQRTTDDYYTTDEPASRYMHQNAYGSQVVILERDPYTGRYYQVSPYGYYSGSPYLYNNRYYNDRYYNNRYYQTAPREYQSEKPRESEKLNKVREMIRGKSNN
jgi:hypothetical protein